MNIKHTPGPWIAEGGDGHGNIWIGTKEGVYVAGTVLPIHGTTELSKEQAEANARLIAAAPDMLQALIDLRATLDPYDIQYGNQVDLIEGAIAKAIGTQEPKAEEPTPTGCMLDVDGYVCSYEEFLRENAELDIIDRDRVGDLKRGESVYLGIQEVKRIQ